MTQFQPFNRPRLKVQRQRASVHFAQHDFLLQHNAQDLLDRLQDCKRQFATVLHLGAYDDGLRPALQAGPYGINTLVAQELCAPLLRKNGGHPLQVVGDEEYLPYKPHSFDLVISNLALQWVNDLPGCLLQIKSSLKPDGLLLASLIGGDSLLDVRACLMQAELEITGGAVPRLIPTIELRTMGDLLQRAGFALPVIDRSFVTVTYPDLLALLRDLKGMGAGGSVLHYVGQQRPALRRDVLALASALYAQKCGLPDGRVKAVFELVHISGWSPHQSQPQPLARGSATASLKDVL